MTSTTPAAATPAALTNFAPAELVTMAADALEGKLARFGRYVPLNLSVLATYAAEGTLDGSVMPVDALIPATDADPAEYVYTDAKGGRWILRSKRGLTLLGVEAGHAYAGEMKPGQIRAAAEKIAAEIATAKAKAVEEENARLKAELEALKAAKAETPAAPKATGRTTK
ncbi:hypothetical protein GCM10010466_39730 [Planomonospora alba]|uniref:Uncharacterized protein n=1 Tax=Planomonospora alba TaxID=161354 RepID=A0ABP6NDH9_9ACTN